MILKTLTLKNFRKFKQTTIEFPDGIIGIVGLNGVGKSTIFEAIAWALYGPVAARTSSDQIKRQNAPTTEPCRAELEFIFEEDNYRITREMIGKTQTPQATIMKNGKIAATGAETVTKYIQKKLGMDFKSFYTSIFAKQKELNTLSSMNPSERRPLILRMLGIDSLDEIIKEIRSDKKTKDQIIQKLTENLTDEQGKDKEETYKQEIKKQENKKQEIKKEIKKIREKLQNTKKELKELENNVQKNKKEYEKLRQKKEKQLEKQKQFEQKNKLIEEINKLKEKIKERKKTVDTQNKKLKTFRNLENELKITEEKLEETTKKTENFIKKIEQQKTIINRLKKDIIDITNKKKNIEKLGPDAKCPTCERILSDQYNFLLKKFNDEIKNKEIEVKQITDFIKKQEFEREKINREQNALQKKKNYLQGLLREKEKIKTTIKNLSHEIISEELEIELKEKKLREVETVVFDEQKFKEIKNRVEKTYEDYQIALRLFNDKKDEVSNQSILLERIENEIKLVDQNIEQFREKISEIRKYKKQLKEEKQIMFYLNILSDVMSSFRTHLISRIRPTLSYYSSDFFSRLTDGKYTSIELDENYNILIYDNGEFYGIERFSGGEEDLANLCLRLAVSEVITERAGGVFNFIILDEIFGSQDVFRRQNIMRSLNGLSSKFRQIFLITHVEDVKNEMEHIIYVTENEDGSSSVTLE